MRNQVRCPSIEQREGKPFNSYEKLGPFTLRESNKGNYYLYEVAVTGGITILKQVSKPGFYDICHALRAALNDKLITLAVFDEYRKKADAYLAERTSASPAQQTAAKQRKARK
jgi:hypothetical protein